MGYASVPPPLFLDILHPRERGALVPDEDKGVYSVDTPLCILAQDGHKTRGRQTQRQNSVELHPRARWA